MPYERTSPRPTPEIHLKNQHGKPYTSCTMDGNDQDPKPCLGIPTAADTIQPTEKDRRKNDREDDTMRHERDTEDDAMPHERTSPRPTPETHLKNQHRKPHTGCTMDGNDPDPKPCLEIPPPQTLSYLMCVPTLFDKSRLASAQKSDRNVKALTRELQSRQRVRAVGGSNCF